MFLLLGLPKIHLNNDNAYWFSLIIALFYVFIMNFLTLIKILLMLLYKKLSLLRFSKENLTE